jgi:amidase
MARYVEDLALLLPVISGPDYRDASVIPVPLEDWRAVRVDVLRIAMYTEFEGATATFETAGAVQSAAQALRDAGAQVEEALPPRIEESLAITRAYWRRPESHSWNEWATTQEHTLTPDQIERSIFAWDRLRRDFLAFMRRFDAIICPAARSPAGIGAASEEDFVFTLPYSLTGQPCAVVRAGASPEGLPIGVQVVAGSWRDDVVLAVARHIERALGGWHAPDL